MFANPQDAMSALKTERHLRRRFWRLLFSITFFLLPGSVFGDSSLSSAIAAAVRDLHGRTKQPYAVGIAVRDADTGELIGAYDAQAPLIPASVQKVLTTYAALKLLGGEYAFRTEILADQAPYYRSAGENGAVVLHGGVGAIYVKGSGDPSLIEEHVLKLAQDLSLAGVQRVDRIVIDDTAFLSPPARSGLNPYQAAQSAASFNHNCVEVRVYPTASGARARIAVPEGVFAEVRNETSTVHGERAAIAVSQDPAGGGRWVLHVTGSIGEGMPPYLEYQSLDDPVPALGLSLRSALQHFGIETGSEIVRGPVPAAAVALATVKSKPLTEILNDLNQYSSNFIAGQILYALGAQNDGRFSADLGLTRIKQTLEAARIPLQNAELYDASGLDRRNRIAADTIAEVLLHVSREFDVLPDYLASLSRFGLRGTLKNRSLDHRLSAQIWGKTGTLDGVSSLAGVLQARSGRRYAFAILGNGALEKASAVMFEDQVVRMLLDR